MQNNNTPQIIGNEYILIQKLYSDEFSEVYKVKNSASDIFALKLAKKGIPLKKITKEIKIGMLLNTKVKEPFYAIKYISSGSDLSSKRTYIVYEFVEKSLFDYIILAQCFDERFAKIVFWKLTNIIQNLYKIGIGGIKLPLENIMIDDNYNLKISGLDSSYLIQDPSSVESSLLENDFYQLSDLVLQLISGKCIFKMQKDKLLKYIQKEKYDLFWKAIEKQNNQKFSKDIKDLINFMFSIEFNKQKKWKLQDFLDNQAWFKEMNSKENEDYFKEKLKKLEDHSEGNDCSYNYH